VAGPIVIVIRHGEARVPYFDPISAPASGVVPTQAVMQEIVRLGER
jgi:hypothetical protein